MRTRVGFSAGVAEPETAAVFVRIPRERAELLDRAAHELKRSKREIVSALVGRYLDPTAFGLEDDWTFGRHGFRPSAELEVLTLEQLAELFQASAEDVLALAESGELPGRRVGGEWRFSRAAVLDWLARPQ